MKRILSVVAAAVALTALVGPPSHASDVAVAATVLPGSRSITVATLTPLADVLRSASVAGTLAVTVTEAAVTGDNAWSVTAKLCDTVPACGAATLVKTGDATKTIPATALSISARSTLVTLGGGTVTTPGATDDLSATRTLFSNAGQDTGAVYTGEYANTSTLTLTVPASAEAGAYTGYLVVDLVE